MIIIKSAKKKVCLILAITIILVSYLMTNTGTAINNNINDDTEYESIHDLPTISEEEYVRRLAEQENITVEEANIKNEKHSEEYISGLVDRIKNPNTSEDYTRLKEADFFQRSILNENTSKQFIKERVETRGGYVYYDLKGTQAYSKNKNYLASVNATLKVYLSGSFGEISQVLGNVWSRREPGSSTSDWKGTNHWYDPTKLPSVDITIGCSGYFEVKHNVSTGGGLSIPGFSYPSTVSGKQIYQSDTMNIRKSYRAMR